MHIKRKEIFATNNLIQHLVLIGLTQSALDQLADNKSDELEINIQINGHDCDINKLVVEWESQVDNMIAKVAKELINDKFTDLNDSLFDLQSRINGEVESKLEDWER